MKYSQISYQGNIIGAAMWHNGVNNCILKQQYFYIDCQDFLIWLWTKSLSLLFTGQSTIFNG
jgi:hypothetical protein